MSPTRTEVQPDNNAERLIDVPVAAIRLSCSERTVWTLIRQKRLPSRRLGNRRLIAVSDLERFMRRLDRG